MCILFYCQPRACVCAPRVIHVACLPSSAGAILAVCVYSQSVCRRARKCVGVYRCQRAGLEIQRAGLEMPLRLSPVQGPAWRSTESNARISSWFRSTHSSTRISGLSTLADRLHRAYLRSRPQCRAGCSSSAYPNNRFYRTYYTNRLHRAYLKLAAVYGGTLWWWR